MWIDSLRAFRSMLASVLSTSLPFYWWTRFMASSMPTAPGWVTSVLGKQFGTATFKTVVTQALFRPVNVFLFLFLQSVFRGGAPSVPNGRGAPRYIQRSGRRTHTAAAQWRRRRAPCRPR